MPLRDHFRPPLDHKRSWDELHGGWPAMIVQRLFDILPDGYAAAPGVRPDTSFEITAGGGATIGWTPPAPTLTLETDLPEQDEYEVRVYDSKRGRRLVAAIEIVSPANKDRPEHRRVFVAKCAALLQQLVSVTIIDLVTTHNFNLYHDLLQLIGKADALPEPEPTPLYAAACRATKKGDASKKGNAFLLETWAQALAVGRPLPTLPLWL